MSETSITLEQLDELWNAIEYTRGTIGTGAFLQSDERPDRIEIHRGRAHQSNAFLNQALEIINQLKRELK